MRRMRRGARGSVGAAGGTRVKRSMRKARLRHGKTRERGNSLTAKILRPLDRQAGLPRSSQHGRHARCRRRRPWLAFPVFVGTTLLQPVFPTQPFAAVRSKMDSLRTNRAPRRRTRETPGETRKAIQNKYLTPITDLEGRCLHRSRPQRSDPARRRRIGRTGRIRRAVAPDPLPAQLPFSPNRIVPDATRMDSRYHRLSSERRRSTWRCA
jgi:hypothetical protein